MSKQDVGLIGLGVMGACLIRNIEGRGYSCSVYNRTTSVTDEFMESYGDKNFIAAKTLEDFVASLERPRRIMVMVKAGGSTDAVIDALLPLVEKGDIIMDMGNSYFKDSIRRDKHCAEKGIHFLGVGVSGGEEGALLGPSIMPGGPKAAWEAVAKMFDEASAKAPDPCHAYIGPDGAGHFVKMVHNGIEYGDMQLIAEAYDLMQNLLGLGAAELAPIFAKWNEGVLSSFLIEITRDIFNEKDPEGNGFLVDSILDRAQHKGTGKWTAQEALDLGIPIPTMSGAVDARFISALKEERRHASEQLPAPKVSSDLGDKDVLVDAIHDALYCSKIISYAQGLAMMRAASTEYSWDLDLGKIASIWRGGCIIRAQFLNKITEAYEKDSQLPNLLLAPFMKEQISSRLDNWRKVVGLAVQHGIPVLAFSSALSYFDSYRRERLPQNLTQAQRDYFGAHTFERTDKSGTFHHTWGDQEVNRDRG